MKCNSEPGIKGAPVNCTSSELSIYLLALEAGYLQTFCSDTNPSVPSKSMPIADKSYTKGNKTVFFLGFPSLRMSKNSTANPGADSPTASAAGSPAKVYPWLEEAPDWTMKNLDSGASRPESSATFDLVASSWRTRQHSLFAAACELLETLPRWGMTLNGELYPQPTPSGLLAHRAWITSESASGFTENVPTPCANGSDGEVSKDLVRHGKLRMPTPVATDGNRGGMMTENMTGQSLPQMVKSMRVPTPKSEDSQCAGGHRESNDTLYGLICRPKRQPTPTVMLSGAVQRLPTPTVDGNHNAKGASEKSGDGLSTAIKRLPTPTQRDYKYPGLPERLEERMEKKTQPLTEIVGGSLNPEWVEWLQGWPFGWTGLKPLAMDKFQQWLHSHGVS